MQISEADLGAAMLAGLGGDGAAYATALHEIARRVRVRVRRRIGLIGNGLENDLEDVVQEVLLSVHLKRATWDASRSVMPWGTQLRITRRLMRSADAGALAGSLQRPSPSSTRLN